MTEPPLTKEEVNSLYYDTVGGEIVFETEGQGSLHATAVGRLLACHALTRSKRRLRLLELGANNCVFATALLTVLRQLKERDHADLEHVEYFAVDFSRTTLEAALEHHRGSAAWTRLFVPPGGRGTPLVGSLFGDGAPSFTLHLVNADATAFIHDGGRRFDVAILNELLDDLGCRVFYADRERRRFELVAHAVERQEGWVVRIDAETRGAGAPELPAACVTASSRASLDVVRRAAELLEPGGVLLVHDYGFADDVAAADQYAEAPRTLPPFVTLELPSDADATFPRSFYRVFGNERWRIVQITNDVNFGELRTALAPTGRAVVVPHGNALLQQREWPDVLRPDDRVFLSECIFLTLETDFDDWFARLYREQEELRARYVAGATGGRTSIFADLLYVKNGGN